MRTKTIGLLLFVCLGFAASRAEAYVVRAPLVGMALPATGTTPPASWFTETRIVNLGMATATVGVTDVIGYGTPARLMFTIPPLGIEDLPFQRFIDTHRPTEDQQFLALVEFTSDQPISLYTAITTYTLTGSDCPSTLIPPVVIFAHWGGGCVPISGPLVRGFTDYLQGGVDYLLPWLVGDDSFRCNLYLINPGPDSIAVDATYRKVDATDFGHASFLVAPHSMLIIQRALQTALGPGTTAGGATTGQEDVIFAQGAITGVFRSTGPFYVVGAVANNDLYRKGKDVINRFAMVQPEPLP